MPRIIDYVLMQRTHSQALTEDVQKLIDRGWQPYGQPFAAGGTVVQAIVLYEGDSKDPLEG